METAERDVPAEKRRDVVLDLLRGGDAEAVCRRHGVDPGRALAWKERFLDGGARALRDEDPVITLWKSSLRDLLAVYDRRRASGRALFPWLFAFFLAVNVGCYWWGVSTAFPELLRGRQWPYYFKIQFPVGLLGALFDSLSFFVTVYIVRRALRATSAWSYLGHLSVDLLIAVVATGWVLFVFWISGWIIGFTEADPQTLAVRAEKYERIVVEAVRHPARSYRNLYFGAIMGFSTLIPTFVHLWMSLSAVVRHVRRGDPDAAPA